MNFDFLRISSDKRFKNFFYFYDSLDTRGLRPSLIIFNKELFTMYIYENLPQSSLRN